MELTALQKKIIEAKENKIAVSACAAALKTSTLIEKVRVLLKQGIEPSSIGIITFTRMAAQELIERLGSDYKDGIFIGTIHSLAAHFLVINNLGSKIGKIAEDEDFDKLFDLCSSLNISQFFDWLFVDECMDCGENELNFIFNLINPKHYFVCYDLNQSIYGFKGARPDLLIEYLKKTGATYYSLNENYRNGKSILTYAKKIITRNHKIDNSIPKCTNIGTVIEEQYDIDFLCSLISKNLPCKDWAILCRTNEDVEKIIKDLNKKGFSTSTFKQGKLTKSQLEKIMNEDKIKVLTVHSSKGLAWNNIATYGLRWWNEEEVRLNYVAATRAKNILVWFKSVKKK